MPEELNVRSEGTDVGGQGNVYLATLRDLLWAASERLKVWLSSWERDPKPGMTTLTPALVDGVGFSVSLDVVTCSELSNKA